LLNMGLSEILIIATLVLIFVGPEQLPQLMRTLGRTYGKLRRASDELRRTFQLEVDKVEADARAKEIRARREALEARREAAAEKARARAEAGPEPRPDPLPGPLPGEDEPPGATVEAERVLAELSAADEEATDPRIEPGHGVPVWSEKAEEQAGETGSAE